MSADQFSSLAEKYLKQKLFTHVYAECGFLNKKEPAFSFAHLPASRFIFDLASITKALVTTPLYFKELKDGKIDFKIQLGDWIPAALKKRLSPILLGLSVEELLKHQSGLPAWRNFWVCAFSKTACQKKCFCKLKNRHDRMIEGLNRAAAEISKNRGKEIYSDLGFILLGLCLEKKLGINLAEQFLAFCTKDLGFDPIKKSLRFFVHFSNSKNFVPTGFCKVRNKKLVGLVHDENAAALGGISGHAGLFGSGPGVSEFLKKFFAAEIGKVFLENSIHTKKESLFGWRRGNDYSSETFCSGNSFGHMGFTGTAFWICPKNLSYAIILTNRVISGRTSEKIKEFRREGLKLLGKFL